MINVIIFDLGKVLLDFDNHLITRRLERLTGRPQDEIFHYIFETPLETQFNTGEISPREFFRQINDRFPLGIPYEEFVPLWCDIFTPVAGMAPLVEFLAGKYSVGILSNTNCLHFDYIRERFPVVNIIKDYFLSFEMGMQKPDEKVYRRIIEHYGCTPDEIAYTDDIARYVGAARGMGIQAFQFTDTLRLRADLSHAGVDSGTAGIL